jgi:hypothetical protein
VDEKYVYIVKGLFFRHTSNKGRTAAKMKHERGKRR